ncbi:MAG TPA: prephenate dehydrogenase/arogenate dehydrogenase family protein [Planctomycetaceae bacterium]
MSDATGTSGGAGTGTLGVAGVGLIGGSIAAAVKARGMFGRVIGFGRSVDRLEAALRAGLIDDYATEYGPACRDADLFVSCLPVDRIADSLREAAARMKPGSVVTDAGSVKRSICSAVGPEPAPGVTFVGSHPLAGSERQGFEHADADLFVGRTCVLTPCGGEPAAAVERVASFWRGLGSEVVTLSAGEHDAVLARTSHLPHLVAAAVAAALSEGQERFAAGGFRDTTRIAAGDPDLWASILLGNREAVGEALGEFIGRCEAFRRALAAGDGASLRELLHDAKRRRDAFARVFK